ncbi:CC0125/CC1285 family lipoprotein [Terricaulis sp.]|uniref:CC0125/CC1285 family lipoprotein n=1 Tax=Terricaulis sp. TaxID=2768686 RepID=UPI003784B6F1
MSSKSILLPILTIAVLGAPACTTAGYRPQSERSAAGYSETRTGEASWSVEYVGASADSRETVERYMLRRAAEITLENGYDWFLPVRQDVTEQNEIVVEAPPPPRVSSAEAVWRPRWRRRSMFGWSDWDPRGPAPHANAAEPEAQQSRVVNQFAATADFTMGRGEAPAHAFDARAISARPPS